MCQKWPKSIFRFAKFLCFFFGSSHDDLPELVHFKALEKSLGIQRISVVQCYGCPTRRCGISFCKISSFATTTSGSGGRGRGSKGGAPCVTFRRVVVSLRGPGQSPVLPFACCVGSLRSVGRCGRCSCWCRSRVRVPPLLWLTSRAGGNALLGRREPSHSGTGSVGGGHGDH